MGLSSLPPNSSSISIQLQQRIRTGILWVIGATLLLAVPSAHFGYSQSAFGVLLVLGFQNAINLAIERAIVQSPRQDQAFLNTAWTLQILCGIVCCLLGCGITGCIVLYYKLSLSYWLPTLGISSFAIVVTSLSSTKIASAERNLSWGSFIKIYILVAWMNKAIGFVFVIFFGPSLLASQSPSLEVLFRISLSAILFCFLSHFFVKGVPNCLQWDTTALGSIYRYGSWIVGITILEFIKSNIGWILVGHFLSLESVGFYYFYLKINQFIIGFSFIYALRQWILFPVYSQLVRTHYSALYSFLKKSRLMIIGFISVLALCSIPLGRPLFSMIFGNSNRWEPIISLLPFLSAHVIVTIISSTYDDVLYAQGKTSTLFSLTAIQVVLEIVLVLLGIRFGLQGVLFGSMISAYLIYFVKAIYFSRQSLWQPIIDFPFLAIASILLVIFFSQEKGSPLINLG